MGWNTLIWRQKTCHANYITIPVTRALKGTANSSDLANVRDTRGLDNGSQIQREQEIRTTQQISELTRVRVHGILLDCIFLLFQKFGIRLWACRDLIGTMSAFDCLYLNHYLSDRELKFINSSYFKELLQNLEQKLKYSKNSIFVALHCWTLLSLMNGY